MNGTRVGRNDPCPCGSGRKFKHCCLRGFSQPVSHHAGGPPNRIASVTTYSGSPHPPNQRCKVFDPQTRRWKDALFKEIQPEQEFIADNRLYKMWSRDVTAHLEGLDVSRIPDADRPFDPANCRTPKANDVVLVLGDKYPNCGHWLLGHLNPGQRCLFQGRVYAIEADSDPRNCKLIGTDLLLVKRPPRLPEQEEAIFKNVVVRETRLTCAPMPAYQGLEGTLTPPTPEEFGRKYERIRRGDPLNPTEVIFHYTYSEPFGYAEVELLVAADKFFELPNGALVSGLEVKPGMEIRLTDGTVGKITRRQTCFDIPEPPQPVENGLWVSRVTARVKHTALEILQWRLGDLVIEGTPGHIVWSVTRRGWVRAYELQAGEFVRPVGNVVVPVESVGPLKTGRVEVYGIEVEFFHNYFVGRGEDSMLVHNGPECIVRPVERDGRTVNVYDNVHPGDVTIVGRKPGFRLQQRDGKWVTVSYRRDGTEVVFTANGTYHYVVQNGNIRVIRPQDLSSHTALAGAGPVDYAGQIKFGSSRGNRGQIQWWDNGSGHFLPRAADAPQAGLPMDRFRPHPLVGLD